MSELTEGGFLWRQHTAGLSTGPFERVAIQKVTAERIVLDATNTRIVMEDRVSHSVQDKVTLDRLYLETHGAIRDCGYRYFTEAGKAAYEAATTPGMRGEDVLMVYVDGVGAFPVDDCTLLWLTADQYAEATASGSLTANARTASLGELLRGVLAADLDKTKTEPA
jgi:hypothetical protein